MITNNCHAQVLVTAALGCAWLAASPYAAAQKVEQGVAIVSETIASRVDGFSYSPDSASKLDFAGTSLGLGAAGEASVKVSHGKTEISGKFQKLPEPSSLGPFAVYILWLVTPEGRAINIGMLNREDDRARIEAVTPLSSFALIVTAEPHFAVSIPSKFVVLQNVGKGVKGVKLAVTSLAAREDYSSLQPVVADKKNPLPLDLVMARYAMAIAQAADAQELAKAAYDRGRTALQAAEAAQVSKKSSDRARVAEYAREAIQAGEDARAGAETRRTGAEKASQADQLKDRELVIKDEEAKGVVLQAELAAVRQRLLAAEKQLPSPASRIALASELLSKWFTIPPPTDTGLMVHVAENSFVKARTELEPAMQQRLSLATGALLGIGKLSVSVSPSVQSSNDVQKLALSQQRARAVMEWLQSMGVQAVMGTAAPDAEASLAMGPGIDLVIVATGS